MRRLLTIALAIAGSAALLAAGPASGGDDPYEVRAIFDTAGFLVPGEEVRVAGVKVGEVTSVDVTRPDEIVSLEDGGKAVPGRAAVVMRIDDEAFQDFRADASCLIQPQSLIGEKFVGCRVTEPRAPGTELPPPLERIPEGQPGEGQLLLPLERNGKAVDLDLVNNILRRPFAERFRLILNDLGAGLAARGEDLQEIVERSNPALRETDEVLAILAEQNRALEQLAEDSDTVLAPLARERAAVGGFIANAGETATAAAERRADIEAWLERFPGALRELRLTMAELRRLSDRTTPVLADFRRAAPSLTRASEALVPFAPAATGALRSLGAAAEASEDDIRRSDPVIRDVRKLATDAAPGAEALAELLRTLDETGGIESLMDFIFFTTASVNGFDEFGHFVRGLLLVTNCVDYEVTPLSGCSANWAAESGAFAAGSGLPEIPSEKQGAGKRASAGRSQGSRPPAGPSGEPEAAGEPKVPAAPGYERPEAQRGGLHGPSVRGGKALYEFLMEDGP